MVYGEDRCGPADDCFQTNLEAQVVRVDIDSKLTGHLRYG